MNREFVDIVQLDNHKYRFSSIPSAKCNFYNYTAKRYNPLNLGVIPFFYLAWFSLGKRTLLIGGNEHVKHTTKI